MSWFAEITPESFSGEAEKSLSLPIGMASPLWFAYGGMAAGAVGCWMMSRWAQAANLEAFAWPELTGAVDAPAPAPSAPEILAPTLIAEQVPVLESAEEALESAEAAADDLTRLVGIGPTLAAKLGELGVTQFSDIAAWTDTEVENIDRRLKLMGRITREAWIEQARQLAEAGLA